MKFKKNCTFLLLICCFYSFMNAQNNNYQYQYEIVKMDSTFEKDVDLTLETYMAHLKIEKDKLMNKTIGYSKDLLKSFAPMSPLSNLLVDILFKWGNDYLLSKKMPEADLALLNFGGIRAALPQGKITVGDIYQIAPFDNTVTIVLVKGNELKKMFNTFTEKRNAPMANVQTIYQNGKLLHYTINGALLDHEKIYTLITINFLAQGGDYFLSNVIFESVIDFDKQLRDVYIEEIQKKHTQGIEIEAVKDDRVFIRSTP